MFLSFGLFPPTAATDCKVMRSYVNFLPEKVF